MNKRDIIIICALCVIVKMLKKATYQTGGGGLMGRPMPHVEYINSSSSSPLLDEQSTICPYTPTVIK